MLTNCVLTGNSAGEDWPAGEPWHFSSSFSRGGGAYGGMLNNCVLTGNSAGYGGGAFGCTLRDCTLADNSVTDYKPGWHEQLYPAGRGGGASESTLHNCTIRGNSSNASGGGASDSTLYNCVLTGNSAEYGGGIYLSILNNCVLTGNSASGGGGGAYQGTLHNCTLTGNSACDGGGTYRSTLHNCNVVGNLARCSGGGAYQGTLYHCTVTGNSATGEWETNGGGVRGGTLNNCIVYFNQASDGPNWAVDEYGNPPKFEYCCTTPLPPGPGNIAADPLFVNAAAGGFRLRPDSPCVNAGSNEFAFGDTDLAGNPRIIGGKVDMGAYEYQFDPGVPIFTAMSLTSAGLRIEWQATAIGSTLQRSATLNPPAWQDVPGSETVTTITVPVTQTQEFFRLVNR